MGEIMWPLSIVAQLRTSLEHAVAPSRPAPFMHSAFTFYRCLTLFFKYRSPNMGDETVAPRVIRKELKCW